MHVATRAERYRSAPTSSCPGAVRDCAWGTAAPPQRASVSERRIRVGLVKQLQRTSCLDRADDLLHVLGFELDLLTDEILEDQFRMPAAKQRQRADDDTHHLQHCRFCRLLKSKAPLIRPALIVAKVSVRVTRL